MASYMQLRTFSSVQPRAAATGTSSRGREAAPPRAAVVNYRRILGVGPNASKGEVKAAYRKLALQCHPDVCGSDDSEVDFMEVNRAYESLMAQNQSTSHCFSSYSGNNNGFGASAPASSASYEEEEEEHDSWADFMQSPLRVDSDEELQVDYSSYYSNLKCYGSKASRSKNSYLGASQYFQGNW